MACIICNSDVWQVVHFYNKPDKYEHWLELEDVKREWAQCLKCGHYTSFRTYPVSELNRMYEEGYRSEDFRGETIGETFDRIASLGPVESENYNRVGWFCLNLPRGRSNVLDIGSGLGVFPNFIKNFCGKILCVEPNADSRKFIKDELNLPCVPYLEATEHNGFDCVTLVHVLEHFENPLKFLTECRMALQTTGAIFIEVPDAVEFKYLEKDHDEFNSCHCHFFDTPNLYKLVSAAGFQVSDIRRVHYPITVEGYGNQIRDLRRILLIGRKES